MKLTELLPLTLLALFTVSVPGCRSVTVRHGSQADSMVQEDEEDVVITFKLLAYVQSWHSKGGCVLITSEEKLLPPSRDDGFLFQVIAPHRFAGKFLTVHWNCSGWVTADGPKFFQPNEIYRLSISTTNLNASYFELCGEIFKKRFAILP